MLAAERRLKIVALIRDSGVATTKTLASELNVSPETVRRDLEFLAKTGVIDRVHGGASAINQPLVSSEPPFDIRSEERVQRKKRIARAAAGLVPQGGIIFLDIGSTALLTARALSHSLSATIVTTSLRVALELAERPGLEILTAGGRLRQGDLAVSGSGAVEFIKGVQFDLALLGSGGLHAERGLTDYYAEEAHLRGLIIKNASRSFVLADATKFNHVARYHVSVLENLTGVVTDEVPGGLIRVALDQAGLEMVIAE